MSWIPWPESIKKRACRYVLQNYVGEYLHEKLRLEQLNVDLYQGTGSVDDLRVVKILKIFKKILFFQGEI